ncbi:MAG: hypothetical protein V4736_08890 [Bdellovibrionota bacterium]
MSDRKLNQILGISVLIAVIVTMMNAPSRFSEITTEVKEKVSETVANTALLHFPEAVATRYPAGTLEDEILKANLFCKEKMKASHATRFNHVSIEGSNCDETVKDRNLEIKNMTNGSSVTYFKLKKNKFKTDLIFLSPGKNHIAINYKNPKGLTVSQTIEIVSLK